MKINGTVKNAKTDEPISRAKVELSVDESEIAVLYTNDKGEFETSQSGDYIGETLVCKVEKEEFEDAEIKQEIEEEENTLNMKLIPVHVPPKKITINGSVVDDESNTPIVGAYITFRVPKEKKWQQKSGKDGSFSLVFYERHVGKMLEYEAKKEGYQLLKGKTKITEDMRTLDIRLKTGKDWTVKYFNFITKSPKRLLIISGVVILVIVILLFLLWV